MNELTRQFRSHMRQVHMDFHMPEFPLNAIKNFNAKVFVDHLERGLINMVALFSKCHFGNAFYNTRVGHKHAGLKQDFLMETVTECRRRGIYTYAYYSLCSDVRAYSEHPNWRFVDRSGNTSGVNGPWARVCLNSPYKEELVLPQISEIVSEYPVDAFWLDIPIPTKDDGCFCENCRRKYAQLYGTPLTDEISKVEGVTWNFAATTNLIKEIRNILRVQNKDIKICTNASGSINAPLDFTEANDILCWESQPRSGYLYHSFVSRYVRTLDRPCQVMSVRFYSGWGDLTLKPAAQMTTEFAAMIGNGATAVSGDQVNVDGSLTPAVYEMFNRSFGFVKAREELLLDAVSIKEAAVLAPVRSSHSAPSSSEADTVKGAHKVMVESHLQHDIVNGAMLDSISAYRVVILPEPCDYDDRLWDTLRNWVRSGGTLIACGGSTMSSGTFNLEDVFGIEYVEPSVFSVSHFKPAPQVQGETDSLPLQCRAATQKIIARQARPLAEYFFPQSESTNLLGFRHPDAAPPADGPSPYPFATINEYGKGKAVYIAGSLFSAYWTFNHHWLRQFFEAVYLHAVPDTIFRGELPTHIEVNVMELPSFGPAQNPLLVNLIHYQVGHQAAATAIPSIEKTFPFFGACCRVRCPGAKKVVLEPCGKELAFTEKDGYVSFVIPEFTVMATVRVTT